MIRVMAGTPARTDRSRRDRAKRKSPGKSGSTLSKSAQMARVKSKNSEPELLARCLLRQNHVRYRIHVPQLPGRPDIYIPRLRLAIFINGCFWHGHDCERGKLPSVRHDFWAKKIEVNRLRDARVRAQLSDAGIEVMEWWTCERKRFPDRCRLVGDNYAARSKK